MNKMILNIFVCLMFVSSVCAEGARIAGFLEKAKTIVNTTTNACVQTAKGAARMAEISALVGEKTFQALARGKRFVCCQKLADIEKLSPEELQQYDRERKVDARIWALTSGVSALLCWRYTNNLQIGHSWSVRDRQHHDAFDIWLLFGKIFLTAYAAYASSGYAINKLGNQVFYEKQIQLKLHEIYAEFLKHSGTEHGKTQTSLESFRSENLQNHAKLQATLTKIEKQLQELQVQMKDEHASTRGQVRAIGDDISLATNNIDRLQAEIQRLREGLAASDARILARVDELDKANQQRRANSAAALADLRKVIQERTIVAT